MEKAAPLLLADFLPPRRWATGVGLALLWLLTRLPYRWQVSLGRGSGRLAMRLLPRRRRIAAINLKTCFPQWHDAKRRQVLRDHFEAVGIAVLEMGICWWWPNERVRRLARVEGLEHLDAALARGKGVILLGAHFTSLELGLRLLDTHIEPLIHPVYQVHPDPLMERVIRTNRERHSGPAIRHDSIRDMLRVLKDNKVVWYAPDQAYGGKASELVPFFGVPASTNTSTSRLAAISGAAVVALWVYRLPGDAGYRVVLSAPFADFPSDNPGADAARYHRFIEHAALAAPEQYLWIHRRFKGRPGLPDLYA